MIPFDGERRAQTAQEFIDHELIERLGATWVSVGENFRFGNRARGDTALLREQTAFETRVTEMVELEGEIVSSTHIRGLVAGGQVAEAARFLGAPFETRGIVAHGDKRGRTLGFPTANLVPDPALAVPDHGIYACRATVPGLGEWTAAVSIGVRPTFVTGRGLLVEAFLLDFDGDLYGRELRLQFVDRIRGEKRFDDRRGPRRADGPRRGRDRPVGLTTGQPFGLDRGCAGYRDEHAGAASPCLDAQAPPDRSRSGGCRP